MDFLILQCSNFPSSLNQRFYGLTFIKNLNLCIICFPPISRNHFNQGTGKFYAFFPQKRPQDLRGPHHDVGRKGGLLCPQALPSNSPHPQYPGCPWCPHWGLGQQPGLARIRSQLPATALAMRISTSPGHVEMGRCDSSAKLLGCSRSCLSFCCPWCLVSMAAGAPAFLVTKQKEGSKRKGKALRVVPHGH